MKIHIFSSFIVGAMLFMACSSQTEEISPVDEGRTPHTAVLYLEGSIERFDAPATRTTTADWDDGATIYIQYQTNNGLVDGTAVYNQSKDEWTVNYYGTITKGQNAKCEVYFFDNHVSVEQKSISLNAHSAAYADNQATYHFEDGIVLLKAHIKPLTGRLRFKGEAGYQFSFSGLKWYNGYNISNNTISRQDESIILTIGADSYTPYVYATFSDASERQLSIYSSYDGYTFRKCFENSVLATGKGGFINVPTIQSCNGWQVFEKDPLGLCPDAGHPHLIDMGTDVLFSCCNLGAASPINHGDYYAWGETTNKNTYDWNTYKWCNGPSSSMTKYNNSLDNKNQLELSDDAAHVNRGEMWHIPTINDLSNLYAKCTWTWVTINNVKGYKVTAKNGNILFLPAAGYMGGTSLFNTGSEGVYWSSSLDSSDSYQAQRLFFRQDRRNRDYGIRGYGYNIRPVADISNAWK